MIQVKEYIGYGLESDVNNFLEWLKEKEYKFIDIKYSSNVEEQCVLIIYEM